MTIEEIYSTENISVRSFNICKTNDLNDLGKILQYYFKYKTFKKLRNCGTQTNDELRALVVKYNNYNNDNYAEHSNSEKISISTVNNFTQTQNETVNIFIEVQKNSLTNRGINALNSLLNWNFTINNIYEKISNNDNLSIKNIGPKTFDEIKLFFDSIFNFTKIVHEKDNEKDLIALRNKLIIEMKFSISSIPIELFKTPSIFSLVNFLINQEVIFNNKENIIFNKGFKIYNNQPEITTESIAEYLNVSRERIRQIRKEISEEIFNHFDFIKIIEEDLYLKYNINQNLNFIIVEEELNNLINGINKTNFSKQFNIFIIYKYLSDQFDLIGKIENVLLPKYSHSFGGHNWKYFYLVNKKLSCVFNFIEYANDLEKRLNEKIEETYVFNFNSYILSFFNSNNLNERDNVLEVAEIILNKEFDIFIDTDDNIKFNRNTLKQVYEYAYEALNILGKPSKLNEITKKIEELHPEYETTKERVRGSLKRENGFVPIGRSSIFGLKKWEIELENFKGGTIRHIVSEYLESEINPKHISDITKYVLNYRPNTYDRSILDNIKADQTKTFISFKNSTIGLRSKKYDKSFIEMNQINLPKAKSWEERFDDLEQFIGVNNRLPYSSGCTEEEIKLYNWYNIQERKNKNRKLEGRKSNLLSKVTSQFNGNHTKRKKSPNSLQRFIDLKQFVILNNKLPSANKTKEAGLYSFFYKQKKLFEQKKLEQPEERIFLEIAKIILNKKYESKRK